jgi:cobalt/nickel transport system permease protein
VLEQGGGLPASVIRPGADPMHIPDGFLSPQTYLPAYALAGGLWAHGLRRLRETLDEVMLPRLAVLTAGVFVVMTVAVPLPGGTTAHAAGVGVLAVLFGVWTTFVSISLVLGMQALLFGEGGVTSLPVDALAMGLAGAAAACWTYRALRPWREPVALFLAGWVSLVLPALLLALVLGVQPAIAHDVDGTPLFFPFGLAVTLPAVVLPHALMGVGEGALTVLVVRLLRRRR